MEENEKIEAVVTTAEAPTLDAEIESLADATVPEAAADVAAASGQGAADGAASVKVSSDGAEASGQVAEEATADGAAESGHVENGSPPDLTAENELFERGIKAGIPMKELLEVPTHAMAERMVTLAEKANGISQTDKGGEAEVAGNPDDDYAAAIEEMEKDGEYDPKILRVLKGLQKENAMLKSARETADRQGFFEQQFGSLDKAVRSRMDAVRLSQLRSKYDVLEAGYRASGSKIAKEDVFQEAARLALGDLMNQAAEERKADALEQRRNLTLARPGGENGQTRGGVPADDPFADFVSAMG